MFFLQSPEAGTHSSRPGCSMSKVICPQAGMEPGLAFRNSHIPKATPQVSAIQGELTIKASIPIPSVSLLSLLDLYPAIFTNIAPKDSQSLKMGMLLHWPM